MNRSAVQPAEVISWAAPSMGGVLSVWISTPCERRAEAADAARRAAQRIQTWASRLTRFSDSSDLSRLNSVREGSVRVRPTLAAALRWAQLAEQRSEGVVDATLLDARLAAESGQASQASQQTMDVERAWSVVTAGRESAVSRSSDLRFDLDGLAKGWIADRAADLLARWPGVAVDADGDVAVRLDSGVEWLVDIADPRAHASATDAPPLATLRLRGGDSWSASYGVATSGTSVHRWQLADGRITHHLIDRRSGHPAETDVVQATIVAPSASEAEMIAKSAVILGSSAALPFLGRSAALAAVLLLESGDLVSLPGIEAWLA